MFVWYTNSILLEIALTEGLNVFKINLKLHNLWTSDFALKNNDEIQFAVTAETRVILNWQYTVWEPEHDINWSEGIEV